MLKQIRKVLLCFAVMGMMFLLLPTIKPVQAVETVKRTSALKLLWGVDVTYTAIDGTTKVQDSSQNDITDSAEGWQWYLNGNSELGYGPSTLVLDGIDIEANEDGSSIIAVGGDVPTTIVIKGTNTIKSTASHFTTASGIYQMGVDITITGDGTLSFVMSAPLNFKMDYSRTRAIYTDATLTVKGVTLNISQDILGTTESSDASVGIYGKNVYLEDTTITSSSIGASLNYGIRATEELKVSGDSHIQCIGTTSALSAKTISLKDGLAVLGKKEADIYTVATDLSNDFLVEKNNSEVVVQDAKIDKAYNLTYDGNGSTSGSVPADEAAYFQLSEVTILDNTNELKRGEAAFLGWNTAADGSGTDYAAGDTITISEDTTLYAKWQEAAAFTVTYDGNGNTAGAVPTDGTGYAEGASVSVLGNSGGLAKDGYTFACWNTAADGSGTDYTEGNTFTISSNITLYAKWQGNAAASGTTAKTTKVPKTGDTSASWMWLLAIAVISGGTSAVMYRKKRTSN